MVPWVVLVSPGEDDCALGRSGESWGRRMCLG